MNKHFRRIAVTGMILLTAQTACNIPLATHTPDAGATKLAATISFLQTRASASQTPLSPFQTPIATTSKTILTLIIRTSGNPLVRIDALCWLGPGDEYEVVSAVKAGTQVELLGRGSLYGWYIIRNPIYHDPCWVMAGNLQIDPGYNVSSLPVMYPPVSPTPTDTPTPSSTLTKTNTPTRTNTPTPSNTPII